MYAEDDEAYNIWNKEVGIPADRIVRIGDNKGARFASDNFWMMGDTGYDHMTPEEAAVMEAKQKQILDEMNITR